MYVDDKMIHWLQRNSTQTIAKPLSFRGTFHIWTIFYNFWVTSSQKVTNELVHTVDAPTYLYTRLRPSVCPSVRPSVCLSVRYAFVKTAENGQFCRESAPYPWEGHKSRFRINRSLIQSRIQSLHLQTSVTHGCYFEALPGAPKDPKLGLWSQD